MTLIAAFRSSHSGLLFHVAGGLLNAPTILMDARVNNHSDGTHHLHTQAPEQILRRLIHTHLLSQSLAVQRPTFQVACVQRSSCAPILVPPVFYETQEVWNGVVLNCQHCLLMMPRNALVQRQGHHLILWTIVQARGIHVEATWPFAIRRACIIKGNWPALLRHDLQRHLLYPSEVLR